MKNTKKFISTSLFVLLILTLVSFCFVGFTFARYTSTGTGTATVNVAKWEIKGELSNPETGTSTINFGKLSPLNAEKPAEGGAPRTNSTNATLVVTITNNSDVAADVTIEPGVVTLKKLATPVDGAAEYNEENAKKVFSIKLYKDADAKTEITSAVTLAKNDSLTVYAVVTWTSDVDGIADADANDTMIGQNVESVSYDITWTAVQASKIPA